LRPALRYHLLTLHRSHMKLSILERRVRDSRKGVRGSER